MRRRLNIIYNNNLRSRPCNRSNAWLKETFLFIVTIHVWFDIPLALPAAYWAQNATTVAGQADGTSGSGINYLHTDRGIFISSAEMLYIANRVNKRVIVAKPNDTTAIYTFGLGSGIDVDQFSYVSDIVVIETSIYTLDTFNNRLQQWFAGGNNPILMPMGYHYRKWALIYLLTSMATCIWAIFW